jgi:hypothetical protein
LNILRSQFRVFVVVTIDGFGRAAQGDELRGGFGDRFTVIKPKCEFVA